MSRTKSCPEDMDLAVFFDVDETLVRPSASVQALYERTCDEFGIGVNWEACETFYDQFFEYLGDCERNPYVAAAAEMITQHDLPVNEREFVETYTQAEITATTVDRAVRETIERLHPKATIGVITNGVADIQRRKLGHHRLDEYVDEFFAASETGAPKPHPKMFELAAETTAAGRLVYVGDSVTKDVTPAKQAGFDTVLVGSTESAAADLIIPTHSTFTDILSYLAGHERRQQETQ